MASLSASAACPAGDPLRRRGRRPRTGRSPPACARRRPYYGQVRQRLRGLPPRESAGRNAAGCLSIHRQNRCQRTARHKTRAAPAKPTSGQVRRGTRHQARGPPTPDMPPAGATPGSGRNLKCAAVRSLCCRDPTPRATGVAGTLGIERISTTPKVAADRFVVSRSEFRRRRGCPGDFAARPPCRFGFPLVNGTAPPTYFAAASEARFSAICFRRAFCGSANLAVPSSISFCSIFAWSTFRSISSTTSRAGIWSIFRV